MVEHGADLVEDNTVLAFLADPRSYPERPQSIDTIETHMSRVFLAGNLVYKLKKPIRLSFIDLTSLKARRRSCERELALNQLLAPGVYLKTVPLVRHPEGTLTMGGDGEPVEWLLVMRRLQADRLLNNAIGRGAVLSADVERICEVLGSFYAKAAPVSCSAAELIEIWRELIDLIERSLKDPLFALPVDECDTIVAELSAFLTRDASLITARLHRGRIVDGHGDLRPEHVHLGPPVRLIDRLEFNDRLRWTDSFDEVGFLGLECEMLGEPSIGPQLLGCLEARLGDRPPDRLLRFYRCYRAALRARLTIEHLRDPAPRTPERWPVLARAYLSIAIKSLPYQS